jgi:ubiquinone/menaquinone biosynthesis C-methylase UbiE
MPVESHNAPALRLDDERERVRGIYEHRREIDTPLDLFGLYTLQERQVYISKFFRRLGLSSLKDLRILDVGCGAGAMLRRFLDFGAEPGNCVGIDLAPNHVQSARRLNPNFVFVEGSAAQLPFHDEEFDIVHQATVFTSVLDPGIKRAMASEIMRTLRPGGHFIWYDFAYSNPRNRNVRGIGRAEIQELFGGCRLQFHRVTLAPPVARAAIRYAPFLCRVLWAVPFLRTHYLCFGRKL